MHDKQGRGLLNKEQRRSSIKEDILYYYNYLK